MDAAGIVTVCETESVCDVPYPSSQANHEPACGVAPVFEMTPEVCVQDAAPDSKPGLASRLPARTSSRAKVPGEPGESTG